MIEILFLILMVFAPTENSPTISYTFRPAQPNERAIQVELSFDAGGNKETRIILPNSWSGQSELYRCVRNLKGATPDTVILDTERPATKVVKHPSTGRVTLTYDLISDVEGQELKRGTYNRPIINDRYFYLLSNTSLILPEYNVNNPLTISLSWNNFNPQWSLANSFGVVKGNQRFEATPEEFKKAVFIGGDFRIQSVQKNGGPLLLATRGDWLFSDAELRNLISRVYLEERRIWQDNGDRYSLAVVLPTDEESGNYSGEARTYSFSLYVSKHTRGPTQFAHILAHEMFHLWNSHRFEAHDERLYWFTEGFTDFYAYVIPLRLGITDADEFVSAANRIIKEYQSSTARNLTVEQMLVLRRLDNAAEKLPYQQGFQLALNLNAQIWGATKGKRSLDDAMRDLLRRNRTKRLVLSTKEIVNAIITTCGIDVSKQIDEAIERGATIEPAANALGACANATKQSLPVFEAGFDIDELSRNKVFGKVKPESAAYAAGIREGQKWVGGGMTTDPSIAAEFEIEDQAGRRKVRFYPIAAERMIAPQFAIAQARIQKSAGCMSQLGVHP